MISDNERRLLLRLVGDVYNPRSLIKPIPYSISGIVHTTLALKTNLAPLAPVARNGLVFEIKNVG